MEQDEPFDQMNIRRYLPGTVFTGRHGPFYLLKQYGHGMIFGILPGHVIRIVSAMNALQPSDLITGIYI